jgi:predicted negative regulator of RcsB-dependent stress response
MTIYVSDKEDIEMIKNWWRENGKVLIAAVVATLILTSGWRYWQNKQAQDAANASALYEHMIAHEGNKDYSAVEYDVTSLQANHARSPYAALGAFVSAQNSVQTHNLAAAIRQFDWVINNAKNNDFKQIARVRKARILSALLKYDEALTLLNTIDAQAYLPIINETKGDILAAKGDRIAAHTAYLNALNSLSASAPNRALLQMKFDQVKG